MTRGAERSAREALSPESARAAEQEFRASGGGFTFSLISRARSAFTASRKTTRSKHGNPSSRCRFDSDSGQENRHHRLRLAGPRSFAEPARQRLPGLHRAAREQQVAREGRGRRTDGQEQQRGRRLGRRDHDSGAGHHAAGDLREGLRAASFRRQDADVRARIQHPLRHDSPAEEHRRDHDRAQGARASRARSIRRRRRHAVPAGRASGRHRQRPSSSRSPTARPSAERAPA